MLIDADPRPTAVSYYDERHEARKEFVVGTQRAMPPEETLARIRPHFAAVGITRLADITGLDRLGVPIWCAVRPDSSTLAVDSGKGATPVAAATSAAMEALERSVAEEFVDDSLRATYDQIGSRAGFGPYEHPHIGCAIWSPDTVRSWTPAWDLGAGEEVLVPSALVGLPTLGRRAEERWWAASSNGLASGNHFLEALCAGLYEVIERDVTTCWKSAFDRGHKVLRIDPATITMPVIRGLLDQLDRAGIAPDLLWCPNEFGVPVFIGSVRDIEVLHAGTFQGYGCHLDPEIAMIRAVTEAVQARTLIMAGARDDIFRLQFRTMRATSALVHKHFDDLPTVTSPEVPDASTTTFHGDVAALLARLADRGFPRVVVRALPADHLEVSVVRVFVAGLEGYRFSSIALGERATAFDPTPWIAR